MNSKILMAAILTTIILLVSIYARNSKIIVLFLVVSVFLWTIFIEEARISKCENK